eukprot:gene37611-45687_t
MFNRGLLYLALACLVLNVLTVLSQDESSVDVSPRVLLYKFTPTNPVVILRDFTISYELVNVGNSAATALEIADNYDVNSFDMISNVDAEGFVSQRFDELQPNGHIVFNVTVRPKLSGMYESTRGRLKYVNPLEESEGEADGEGGVHMGYSTSLGRVRIVTEQEYQRSVSYFAMEWGIYAVLVLLPVLLPFTAYKQARVRVEAQEQTGARGKKHA